MGTGIEAQVLMFVNSSYIDSADLVRTGWTKAQKINVGAAQSGNNYIIPVESRAVKFKCHS